MKQHGNKGVPKSAETKAKMSKARSGAVMPEDVRLKMIRTKELRNQVKQLPHVKDVYLHYKELVDLELHRLLKNEGDTIEK